MSLVLHLHKILGDFLMCIASNLLVESRVITVDEPGSKFSYPGIVIVRKMNDGKSFEFNFPITVASRIASAIEIIMKNNGN